MTTVLLVIWVNPCQAGGIAVTKVLRDALRALSEARSLTTMKPIRAREIFRLVKAEGIHFCVTERPAVV